MPTVTADQSPVLPDPRTLAKGLAVLRIFVGLIALTNGLAKLIGFGSFEIGWYRANLINLDETRSILEGEAARTQVPGLEGLVNDVILANYGFFQVVITAVELGVGVALVLGIASRGAAFVGLGQHAFLAVLYTSSGRWAFEQPHEWLPLIILTLVASGRVWGLDGGLLRTRPELRRWPF